MEEVYIREIAIGSQRLKNRMEKDVVGICKLLKKLDQKCRPRENEDLPEALKASLRRHFRDIYWSLKLHVVFHLGRIDSKHHSAASNANLELEEIGRLHFVDLTDEEMNVLPDQEHAIDPGSKLMEIFSAIAKNTDQRDSKHACDVMFIARDLLKVLKNKNIFKPKVLAIVSHNGEWTIGSSIAVSHFLRPLCLYRRIVNFNKQSLKKAIVFYQPLDTSAKTNWSSSAFSTGDQHKSKAPCQNCASLFGNLEGFIDPSLGQGGRDTFLGACAEYCPVDQLLPEEALSEDDNLRINAALEINRNQCTVLFEQFRDIERKCKEACNMEDEKVRNDICTNFYSEIRNTVHIFGLTPECNKYFGGV